MTVQHDGGPAFRYVTAENDVDAPTAPIEERFLREVLKRARLLESRTRGLFAEVLIAESLPGSDLGSHPMSRWDVKWKEIEIAVRTTGTVNSYTEMAKGAEVEKEAAGWSFPPHGAYDDSMVLRQPARRCWTDVVVLAHHDGATLLEGWMFHVLSEKELVALPERISPSRARDVAPAVPRKGLAAAVEEASKRQRSMSSS